MARRDVARCNPAWIGLEAAPRVGLVLTPKSIALGLLALVDRLSFGLIPLIQVIKFLGQPSTFSQQQTNPRFKRDEVGLRGVRYASEASFSLRAKRASCKREHLIGKT